MEALPKPKAHLPVPVLDAGVLNAIGPDSLLGWIANGDRYSVIADRMGIPVSSLACWIHNLPDEVSVLFKAALGISAEILLDQSDEILDAKVRADEILSSSDVALRKYRAESRKFRAGVRNPAYRPGQAPNPTATGAAAAGATAPPIHITISLPNAGDIERHKKMIQGEYTVDGP